MSKKAEIMWSIYESNTQQYRILSVTVQSFILAVGTILFSSAQDNIPMWLLSLIVAIGVFHITFIWIPIVRARSLIVDYYKYQYFKKLSAQEILELEEYCSEKEYVNNPVKRKEVNEKFYNEKGLKLWRATRFKIDLLIPFLYFLIWVFLWSWKSISI